jgi:hypothetical protein
MPIELLAQESPTALWRSLVQDAEQGAGARLNEELESYLVFLLMRHLQDARLAENVLALDLLEALARQGTQREQRLRTAGDRCLLLAGLYPEQAQRRLVSLGYFLDVGRHAYDELACQVKGSLAALYRHLAAAFPQLIRVLIQIRRLSGTWRGPDAFARHDLQRAGGKLHDLGFGENCVLLPASALAH